MEKIERERQREGDLIEFMYRIFSCILSYVELSLRAQYITMVELLTGDLAACSRGGRGHQ